MLAIENVSPIHGLSTERHQIIEYSKILGGGGFSQLRELNGDRVLKLTCCEATHRLLDALQGNAVPGYVRRYLPRVFEAWGECANDPDDKVYRGYVLERLYTAEGLTELRFGAASSTFDTKARRALGQLRRRLRDEENSLGAAQKLYDRIEMPNWESTVDIAMAVMHGKKVETREAFTFLGEFCHKREIDFDLRTPGNTLFGPDGRLILADPVTKFIPVAKDSVTLIFN